MPDKSLETCIASLAQKIDTKVTAEGGWDNVTGIALYCRKRRGESFSPMEGAGAPEIRTIGLERWLSEELDEVSADAIRAKIKGADGVFRRTATESWVQDAELVQSQEWQKAEAATAAKVLEQNVSFALKTASACVTQLLEAERRACRAEAKLEVLEEMRQQADPDRWGKLLDRGYKLFELYQASNLTLSEGVARVRADSAGAVDMLIARGELRDFVGKLSEAQLTLLLRVTVDVLEDRGGDDGQADEGEAEVVVAASAAPESAVGEKLFAAPA